jgi:outer membrane receptor protein involved in Fe transport
VSGGNPNLGVETADTDTIGVILQPSFIDGLTITVDYWDVAIEDAISAVGAGDIPQRLLRLNQLPKPWLL